ncbi:MAG: alpha/beta hydrolase [Deltaproteobacteria bacterium]|nr:alpha/beta hydrolase [Deltaproteobacteria bacterium]
MTQARCSSFTVALAIALLAAALPAGAAEHAVSGRKLLLKSPAKLILLAKDGGIVLGGSDPVGGADSSITFNDGTNVASLSLPASNWSANSTGSQFKYKNSAAPGGPSVVKTAKIKSGLLKVVANGLPIPVPNGPATISVILRLDGTTNVYCMTFTGSGDGSSFQVKNAAAFSCPAAPTPTATITPTASATPTITATPTPRLVDMTPPGAAPLRYRDLVFAAATKTSNVTYGSAVNGSAQTVTLQLDVYEPTGDSITARPAIVWVHGGSFCCGDKSSPEIVDEATTFARKGYFNVSINYRLEPGGCTGSVPVTTCLLAVQEARDDAKTAVRFLRTNAALYGIDPTRIAIAGSSAGAITAVNVGITSTEDPTAAVAGAVSLSGGELFSGGTYQVTDAPNLLFHGTADTIVPYQWAVNTFNSSNAVGLDSFLTSWTGAGHVPYVQHRTEIIDQTTNFLYWEMDLANAAQ